MPAATIETATHPALAGDLQFTQFYGALDANAEDAAGEDDLANDGDVVENGAGDNDAEDGDDLSGDDSAGASADEAGEFDAAQRKGATSAPPDVVHEATATMAAMPRREAPFRAQLARSFGGTLVDSIAWVDGADELLEALGPEAISFSRNGSLFVALRQSASFRVAAHEVAHHAANVKKRPQLADGIGHPGDHYEQAADAAAERAERGEVVATDNDVAKGAEPGAPIAQASGLWGWIKKKGRAVRSAVVKQLNKTSVGRTVVAVGRAVGKAAVGAAKAVGKTLLVAGPFLAGALVGTAKGVLLCVKDIIMGVVDLLKMVWGLAKAIYHFIGDLTTDANGTFAKIWDKIKAAPGNIGKAIKSAPGHLAEKFTKASHWGRGLMIGTAIGYIAAMALLIFFTGGAAAGALAATRFGWILRVLNFFDKAGDIFFIAGRTFRAGKAAGRMAREFAMGGDALRGADAAGEAAQATIHATQGARRKLKIEKADATDVSMVHAAEVPVAHAEDVAPKKFKITSKSQVSEELADHADEAAGAGKKMTFKSHRKAEPSAPHDLDEVSTPIKADGDLLPLPSAFNYEAALAFHIATDEIPQLSRELEPLARHVRDAGSDPEVLRRAVFEATDGRNVVGEAAEKFRGLEYHEYDEAVDYSMLRMLKEGGAVCRQQTAFGHMIAAKLGMKSHMRALNLPGGGPHAVLEWADGKILDFNSNYRGVYDSFDEYVRRTGIKPDPVVDTRKSLF